MIRAGAAGSLSTVFNSTGGVFFLFLFCRRSTIIPQKGRKEISDIDSIRNLTSVDFAFPKLSSCHFNLKDGATVFNTKPLNP